MRRSVRRDDAAGLAVPHPLIGMLEPAHCTTRCQMRAPRSKAYRLLVSNGGTPRPAVREFGIDARCRAPNYTFPNQVDITGQ